MEKTNQEIYIPLYDTDIVNLEVTEAYIPGNCETCDYGQNYIQDIRFEAADDRSFALKFENPNSYPISVSEFTQLILNNLERYREMDYTEFKEEMKDLEDRKFSDIKQKLNPQEIEEQSVNDQEVDEEQIEKNITTPYFANKDVYALVKDPTKFITKVTWDVRNTKDTNDEAISDQAERWGRTAIKIIENGVPTYTNASADQLREIPKSTVSASKQPSIVRDTYNYVQKGLDLSDYNLQNSLRELTQTNTLEQ